MQDYCRLLKLRRDRLDIAYKMVEMLKTVLQ